MIESIVKNYPISVFTWIPLCNDYIIFERPSDTLEEDLEKIVIEETQITLLLHVLQDDDMIEKYMTCDSKNGFTISDIIYQLFNFITSNIKKADRTNKRLEGFTFNSQTLVVEPTMCY
jgi:hypothetical protein